MAKLAFCDYHNMVAILEKTEHNTHFHQIVDFLEASYIRYALTIHPTVYVLHIRQFWSTVSVETTDGEIKILAQVNGRKRTVSESSIRRHLKLNDKEGDVRYEEAFPTDTSLDAGQDRENIAKTSSMPHEAFPRITSLGGGEGNLEITQLKTRVKTLEDNEKRKEGLAQEDASNTRGMDQGKDLLDRDKSANKGSDSTDEMSHVLGSLGAANILASGGLRSVFTTTSLLVAIASINISPIVATTSGSLATTSGRLPTTVIFTTVSVTTPTKRVTRSSRGVVIRSSSLISVSIPSISKKDKGKGKMTEPEQPKLDRSNEMIAKYLSEYEQATVGLSHDEKKSKDFKGMTLEQIEEKFIPLLEKMQDFVPMNSKLESERLKRPRIQLDKEKSKKLKTVKASGTEHTQEQQSEEPKELSEEELKKMMDQNQRDLPRKTSLDRAEILVMIEKRSKVRMGIMPTEVELAPEQSNQGVSYEVLVLLLAWDRVFKIKDAFGNKQYKSEDIQELFRELFNDVQNIHEELAEYINTPGWNHPAFYNNGDDDDEDCTIAITPDFLIMDSHIMGDEHLDTIPKKESDEFISLVDDESSHEEVIHEMSFKTYSNPLFDLDEEIISSEFNPIHNEDVDSTLKNDRFDTESYLLESLLNHDTLMAFSLKFDSLLAEFTGIEDDDYDCERDILILEELVDNYSLLLPENESFHFDIPSFSRPLAKPPDGNTGILNIKMMGDISDQKVLMPRLMITLVSIQEKSPNLLPHQGLKIF
uniref:Uncharacterized protein n=1 Tax=Tanacetum cinerariifolium TaxID=118510 RepID=A0A6L2P1T1_TANCI|nr:hypothetical protein [Tanacetum cinerariifolium]